MKIAAIVTAVLLIFTIGAAAALYMSCEVTVESVSVAAMEAQDQAEYFEQLKSQYALAGLPGVRFRQTELGEAEDYVFYTYTVKLRNKCLVTADMAELLVTPMNEDIVQLADTRIHSLAPGKSDTLTATILTTKGTHSVREINITFYVWGLPFTMKTTGR